MTRPSRDGAAFARSRVVEATALPISAIDARAFKADRRFIQPAFEFGLPRVDSYSRLLFDLSSLDYDPTNINLPRRHTLWSSNMTPLDAAALDRLAKYDTPTVCNVIELWDIRPRNTGFMNGSISACFPKLPPMVGYAVTSTFRSMAPPRSGDVYAGLDTQATAFAEAPGPPVVVYQDLDEPTISATFGEVMCSVYKAFGARGLVTSGAGRDLEQVEALDFPAFTNGTICAHGYCHTPQVNVPVTVGGIAIEPGDLLHGDCNGVSTIPHEIASEVAEACEELMAAEQIVLDYLKGDGITPAGLAEARKACAAQISKLATRLTA